MDKRKVILYISMSLDGFIATLDDDLSWLSIVQKEGEDYGYAEFTSGVDTYIVGRKTYDVVLKLTGGDFPQARQFKCYVLTRKERPDENGITFYSGDVADLVGKLRQEKGGNIYCDGGSQVVKLLMERNLIDEYIVSVIPVLLGDGIRLFPGGTEMIRLKAMPARYFDTGLVQLRYRRE